ncbi:tyrosine--tRNA ligase [Halanaerobium congolense]|jgi:tyrosyl-tRNA synthetase|uniref:Tyrosine--tRNA ligase n=1 Tax=Halanaerobium congolense TaxID=54121 RepID=A0A1M7H9F7_9FIRM|nr:tyrosine--tRNA ligase [Halanaerobium congolense]KXS49119.1 MAG: tyrosyl-tRNA synthetase [Halanaerobium sp. T82-1]OEG62324.1 MAG: tyrosine--tRNA ligase [Halanaerobium sp. MDAL1]PUU92426.1 MAG: tyrosyl-tRNA synthetase [Halanaerobium sp.]PXV62596.1 tyrosyl-tRNA synthetase [Halanaerobium congolense]TDP27038.1 tyrosyl-tRNA synthetase [Halanaerobium congolense]
MEINEQLKILKRGVSDLISEEELEKKLKKAKKEGRPLKVKLGLDPSAPDIHLGHTVVLRKLKQFQDLGHEVYLIIGDFTGMIGDPTGKSETRNQLTKEEVLENAHTYQEQFSKVLDPEKTNVVFNGKWLGKMDFADVLELSAHYTVARMLERDDFSKRYSAGKPIGIHEFFYPLMQGYDSVAIEADVELGGTDQRFNLLVGRKLQQEYGQEPQVVLMMPLLEGLDGVNKMSKSLDNYIGVYDEPADMFGKVMSIPDDMIVRYFELLTDISIERLDEIKAALKRDDFNPMELKKELAAQIVEEYHDKEAAVEARQEFESVFSKGNLPEDIPVIEIAESDLEDGELWIVKLVAATGLVDSNSQVRRLIKQGAVTIDDEKYEKINLDLEVKDGMIIQIGKRRFAKIKLV